MIFYLTVKIKMNTPNSNLYLILLKNSFKNEEDYDFYMRWLSHKINHRESMNQGIIMFNPHPHELFNLDIFKSIDPKLCNYDEKEQNCKMLLDKFSIVRTSYIDDDIKRRIDKCYKDNIYEWYNIVKDENLKDAASANENVNDKKIRKIESINKCDWYITTDDLHTNLSEYNDLVHKSKFKLIIRTPLYKKSEIANCDSLQKILMVPDEFKLDENDIKAIYNYIEEYK